MDKMWNVIEKCMYFCVYKILKLTVSAQAWEKWCQFVKFGIVGLSNTVISYVVYAVLVWASVHYVAANVIGFLVSVFNAYYWNNKYVFKEREDETRVWWKTLAKTFFAYAGTGLVLANILLVLLVQVWSVHEMLAPILILFITTPVNFLANKLWAYKSKGDRNKNEGESSYF
ncbi:MAG: GtrA family protein [Clostridium sp.]|nr:GtrA family protein [Clostridium sp.]